MMIFSHYQFKQLLKTKAEAHNSVVFDVNEAFTSKTCSRCGVINRAVGSSKLFQCPSNTCFWQKIARDINAARNICIRFIGLGKTQ
jgi:putative transposase